MIKISYGIMLMAMNSGTVKILLTIFIQGILRSREEERNRNIAATRTLLERGGDNITNGLVSRI